MCLSACLGPHCLGVFLSSLAETWEVINISLLFTQQIRHFLSHVDYTSNKARMVGNPEPSENWRWTSVGIADTRRKFEWQEFFITLKVVCYFHLYCSYTGSQDKLEKTPKTQQPTKQTLENFFPHFSLFVSTPWAAYGTHGNEM